MVKGFVVQADVEPYFPAWAQHSAVEKGLRGERGSYRLGSQCLRGKASMLCKHSKSKSGQMWNQIGAQGQV